MKISNSLKLNRVTFEFFVIFFINPLRFFSVVLLLTAPLAQATLLEKKNISTVALTDVAFLEDPNGTLTYTEVSDPAMEDHFKIWPADRGQINFGFSKSTYWIRIPLQREAEAARKWVIEVPFFQLHTLDFYAPEQVVIETGGSRPLATRPYLHRFFAFPIEVSPEKRNYYMRVTSHHSVTVPLTVWQEQPFGHHVQTSFLLQALYFGGLIALMIYNLFLSISLSDLRFLLYTFFVGMFGLGVLAGNGFGQMYLWPDQGRFDGVAQTFFLSLCGGFAMLFAQRFLQATRYTPAASPWLSILAAMFFIDAAAIISAPWHSLPLFWMIQAIFILILPAGALVAILGIRVLKLGNKGARFFLLAWLVLWSGAITATLRAFELLPTNTFTAYSLQISSAVEMLLLAFALADIVHLERKEREHAQTQALQANQHMLEIAHNSKEQLEQEVQKRTQQLQRALSAETQLLEKFLRFGALISHEFRNPLGIVDSQISLLRKEHEKGQLNLEKRLDTMTSATRRLLSLFETWLHSDRLQHTMQDIQPQHIPISAWLRELIDAQNHYSENHTLELKINHILSDVWADENLLEVAVLNLIDNACKYSEAGQPVLVEILKKPGWFGIAVTDKGCGIDINQRAAVFDDYHRVNPESTISGIGLGLAFVRRIVEKHQGELELKSAIGKGSTFTLWLPHEIDMKLTQ